MGVINDDLKETAQFLLREERLRPDSIGELLGEGTKS